MRILLIGIFHETHCFVPSLTDLEDFRIRRGAEVLAMRGDGSQIDGFLEVAAREGWEVVPVCAWVATPSGRVTDRAMAAFWADALPGAAAARVDAVFLSLHGAMVSESLDDVEGALLARLRAIPALAAVPIFGVFDLHANLSAAMTDLADGLLCYRENPHIDARDTAVRAADLLARCLATGQRPRMHRRIVPVVWPPTGTGTADTPMRELEALARQIEGDTPDVQGVNIVAGFSFADVADAGVCLGLITTGPTRQAELALDRLESLALRLKSHGLPAELTPDQALDRLAALPPGRGPVLLVEPSENIGAGAPGNGTAILRALIGRKVQNAAVILNDPAAVQALDVLPPGGQMSLALGGRDNPFDAGGVELVVTLVSRSDGRFDLEDRNSHLAASAGRHIQMGPCAVVRHGGVTILLTSLRTPPMDLGQWRSQGLNPEDFAVIGVKAAVAHRRAYEPIMRATFTVATPGACTSDPRLLPYTRLRRPIYPLDRIIPQVLQTPLPNHPLRIWTVLGEHPGPTLALTGAVHGDEMEGPLTLSALLAEVDPERLSGTLIVCPVANADAVAGAVRCSPSDGLNLARCFPGDPSGSYTPALAALIAEHVIRPADALVDLHSGGQALDAVLFAGFGDGPGTGARNRAMAMAFGAPVVWRHPPPMAPGRTLSVAEDAGIPAIYVEASGGLNPSAPLLAAYASGVRRVMAHLGMIDGPDPAPPPRHVQGAGDLDHAIAAPATGLCACHIRLLDPIAPGTLCFTITDPGGALLAQVRAGATGIAMFLRRAAWVNRGELLMALAEEEPD